MKPLNKWTSADIIAFVKSVDKRTWLTALSCAAGFFLLIVFLVIPAWIVRPMLRRDIQSMETQIRQVNILSQKRPGWEEDQKVLGAFLEKTRARVFSAEDLGMLLLSAPLLALDPLHDRERLVLHRAQVVEDSMEVSAATSAVMVDSVINLFCMNSKTCSNP